VIFDRIYNDSFGPNWVIFVFLFSCSIDGLDFEDKMCISLKDLSNGLSRT
jgi:hypothetical protein